MGPCCCNILDFPYFHDTWNVQEIKSMVYKAIMEPSGLAEVFSSRREEARKNILHNMIIEDTLFCSFQLLRTGSASEETKRAPEETKHI